MNKKYNLLLVNYDYPPVGGVGTQRIYHFAKYLKKDGHNPIVLTTKHGLGKYRDESLLEDKTFAGIPVIRIGGEELVDHHKKSLTGAQKYFYYCRLLVKNIWYGQIYYSWFRECKEHLFEIIRDNDIDCVWTTSPSSTSLFFGRHIKSKFNIPWIIDLRDPLVGHTDWNKGVSSWILEHINSYWEKNLCSLADYVVCVSQPMIDNLSRRTNGKIPKDNLRLIPNGFDPDDFETPDRFLKNKKLTITYTGTFLGRRNPDNLIKAVKILYDRNPASANKIKFVFAGDYPASINQSLTEISDRYECIFTGFITRKQVTNLQLSADVLLLLTVDEKDKNAREIITGKVFEYVGAKRPILATAVNGPLKNLILEGEFGLVVSPGDAHELYMALNMLYDTWLAEGQIPYHSAQDLREKYSRQSQTQILVDLIEAATHSNDRGK